MEYGVGFIGDMFKFGRNFIFVYDKLCDFIKVVCFWVCFMYFCDQMIDFNMIKNLFVVIVYVIVGDNFDDFFY